MPDVALRWVELWKDEDGLFLHHVYDGLFNTLNTELDGVTPHAPGYRAIGVEIVPDYGVAAGQHHKMFQHKGERSPETDHVAQELARHAMRDEWPDVADVSFVWVHHNQPDVWLLFVTGHINRYTEAL